MLAKTSPRMPELVFEITERLIVASVETLCRVVVTLIPTVAFGIPGSINVRDVSELKIDLGSAIVVYCDCPNDASAAVIAGKLKAMGFKHVRPLAGGLGAWRAQGFPVERDAAP